MSRPGRNAALALVLGATVLGGVLRFAHLGDVPPALNQDEAVNGYDAYSLLKTGRDHHGHPFPFAGLESFGDWASSLLTFLTVPFVASMGLRTEAVRAATASIGVLAIPLMYGLGTELFHRRTIGVIAAWYIAVSPWAVHRAHFAIPSSIVPTMIALTLFALVWTINRSSARGAVWTAVAAALTIAAYPTMKLYVPLLLVAALVVYRSSVHRLDREALGYALVLFVLIAGPVFYLSVFDPGGRARFEQVSIFRDPVTLTRLAHEYRSYFSPGVFFLWGNGHPGQAPTPPGSGVELRTLAPFLVLGGMALCMAAVGRMPSLDRHSALLLLAALALYPLPGSLTLPPPPGRNPHLGRAIQLIPLLSMIVAVGVATAGDLAMRVVGRRWPRRGAVIVAVAGVMIGTLVGAEVVIRERDYFTNYPRRDEVLRYFQYGIADAVEYARQHEGEYEEIWMTGMNQPYIYVLFFDRWPPSDVHRMLQPRRAPPAFNEVDAIGKYHFGDTPFDATALTVVASVADPNGKVVYELRDGAVPDHGRVLFIHEP